MKKNILVLMLLVFFVQLTGCDGNGASIQQRTNTQKGSSDIIYNEKYTEELNSLTKKMADDQSFAEDISDHRYELTATINLSQENDADRLVYEIFIRKPQEAMEDIVMSFSLDPGMLTRLNTSDVFQSNALNDKPTDFLPDEGTNGISLYRGFVLDKQLLDKQTLNIYKTMYIKITYSNSEGQRLTDYVKMQAEPSDAAKKYLLRYEHKKNNYIN
ncbi:hypothetical protein D3C81_1438290 [compost metagenome]